MKLKDEGTKELEQGGVIYTYTCNKCGIEVTFIHHGDPKDLPKVKQTIQENLDKVYH